ncbi:MAG: RNA polymerase sigma factor [Planctomycetes bacterium]|nr:RNA polymerase sigma factor [Planctomycetota bacterium]
MTRGGREALVIDPAPGTDLAALFRRAGPAAYRLALAITCDPAAAEDVVQESFVRALSRAPEGDGPLDGWLHRTARNLALDHLRRRKVAADRAGDVALLLARRDGPAPDGLDAQAVSRALLDLPLEQREVVLLRVWEGLSFPEVAARVEAPLGTVHSRFRYAMERLRAAFAGRAP